MDVVVAYELVLTSPALGTIVFTITGPAQTAAARPIETQVRWGDHIEHPARPYGHQVLLERGCPNRGV